MNKENVTGQAFTKGSSLPTVSSTTVVKKTQPLPENDEEEEDDEEWPDDEGWGDSDAKKKEETKKDYQGVDLNKLSNQELNQVKKDMDVDFNKNRITKEDPRFQYDVRKDFDYEEKLNGSWDDGMVSNEDDNDFFEDDFV